MNVLVTVSVTPTPLPSGVTYDHITITLQDASGATQTDNIDGVTDLSANFTVTAVGPGAVTAQAVDSTGANLGAPASGAFVIPPVVGNYPQPTSILVTVS
jgi:hypothetical protein